MKIYGQPLVHAAGTGRLLYSSVALSFWAGINPSTGEIIDRHHPLYGSNVRDCILALPGSRGSCSGSLVLIELLLQGCAPAGLIVRDPEQIITLGVIVAQTLLDQSIPVLRVTPDEFSLLSTQQYASISGSLLVASSSPLPVPDALPPPHLPRSITLSEEDQALLVGTHGPAPQKAMEILLRFADLQSAPALTAVSRAHIDACIYTGPASLLIPRRFLDLGARVAIPTTLNSISVDRQRWRELNIDSELGTQADALAAAYVSMGAQATFTCAPYLLESVPKAGESVGWAESNAVVFANSVLGARTQKYPDLIDVCIALTGRAPLTGAQTESGRVPSLQVHFSGLAEPGTYSDTQTGTHGDPPTDTDDTFYPLLGYVVGRLAGPRIPLVTGLERLPLPGVVELKAFGAAFATTASAAMFHIAGVTPEAAQHAHLVANGPSRDENQLEYIRIGLEELRQARQSLTTASDPSLGLVSLGNPHFALEEFARLSELCTGRRRAPGVQMVITTNRVVYAEASRKGYISVLEEFGALILTDTCWCMLGEPVIGREVRNLMTNSAKYAHYAPGMVRRGVHFGGLTECVDAAIQGYRLDK